VTLIEQIANIKTNKMRKINQSLRKKQVLNQDERQINFWTPQIYLKNNNR